MTSPLLELRGVTKRYPAFTLQDASFTLPAGLLMGLIGPNGAGKTTLLKSLLGLVKLDAGTIRFQGRDLVTEGPALRQRIAYVPDEPKFTHGASLRTIKDSTAPFCPGWNEGAWKSLMADFGLDPMQKSHTLSLGQRTRFALTLAMAREVDLLILDEPTTGLDPVFRRELLARLAHGLTDTKAILFSTHITSDLEDRADLVTLLRDGEIVFSKTQDDLRETWGVVKGGLELLDDDARQSFQGLRTNPHGFEGLTDDLDGARQRFAGRALVERASLEEILVLLGRRRLDGRSHAA
ncbi:MAG: ABC transporter ATP-binding protein [Holophagaceae bacterium]|nr:ABC transporter ATP-binding protein [Holophagaceae bacterium]